MLTIEELKKLHDKAYNHNQVPREQASDDLTFYWVTQWDDNLLQDTQLQYRGEFNILRKAGRQIMGDLRLNPVQVDFDPKDEGRDDGAEILDGLYRSDDRRNSSIESYDYASQDAVVCGFGAWELFTVYETNRIGDDRQVIRRRFIPEANNTAFCDPNAKKLDKSDAKYWSILHSYSKDGYKDLVEDLTGERPESDMASFKYPEQSYTFPWYSEDAKIYVSTFYHRELVKDKVLTLIDPLGMEIVLRNSDLEDQMDELLDSGYVIVRTKQIRRWQVTRYIASGHEILKSEAIAGENIPVIPVYGERSFVEGEEYYEGITRLAKDPQRLRNFQMSYLADIVSRSPRPKPIFYPEQIQGYEDMYEENGADNNYPYLLQQRLDANGNPLPLGPVALMPDQPIPKALAASIDLSRQAVEDVANPGLPQNIADPDLSGKAVIALQNRMDQQSYIYQHNMKFAKRRDGEVYASMASEIYDTPRRVTVTLPDGTRNKSEIMSMVIDSDTGEPIVLNDLTNMEFDVHADISPSYASQKQATIDQLGEMGTAVAQTDPAMHKIFQLKQMELMDGVGTDEVREYAKKQLIIMGIRDPETPEEEQLLQNAQQGEPDANMVLAQAEVLKGQAQQFEAETRRLVASGKITDDQARRIIDSFNAQTRRIDSQIDAEEAGVKIDKTAAETVGQKIDNIQKLRGSIFPGGV